MDWRRNTQPPKRVGDLQPASSSMYHACCRDSWPADDDAKMMRLHAYMRISGQRSIAYEVSCMCHLSEMEEVAIFHEGEDSLQVKIGKDFAARRLPSGDGCRMRRL